MPAALNTNNGAGGSGATGVESAIDKAYAIHNSDHPGMMLVSHPLTGNNYLSWKTSMTIALGAKSKLGFINGKLIEPVESDAHYDLWKMNDYMVVSWILNSLSKDIVESFVYAKNAKLLWEDISRRYSTCNGPLLYELQRQISSINQDNETVVEYFSKIRKLWDQYASLKPRTICDCLIGKNVLAEEQQTKLLQFLMGLHESFDQVRSQILLMEPLPNVEKAFPLVHMVTFSNATESLQF